MTMTRRTALALLATSIASPSVSAQDAWPSRSLRLIIGFPPGGSIDLLARALAPGMSRALGQSVVVENRPGAGQVLSAELLANAEPDGYTIGLVDSGPLTVSPHLRRLPFDPQKSFTPIGTIANLPLVIVASNGTGIRNLADLLDAARKSPGKLTYASTGAGSMHNLTGEYLKSVAQIDVGHVPYRGAALAMPDVVAGRVSLAIIGVSGALGQIRADQIRAIGVTSSRRSPALPDVPTVAEQGLAGFDSQGWVALCAPAGAPAQAVARLQSALKAAMAEPAFVQQEVVRGGNELLAGTAEEFASLLARDDARWGRLIRERGIRAE